MEINEIINTIANLGFPLTACIVLWRSYSKTTEKVITNSEKTQEAISANTQALERLAQEVRKDE